MNKIAASALQPRTMNEIKTLLEISQTIPINIEDFNKELENRFSVWLYPKENPGIKIKLESLWFPSNIKKLYVFFSAWGNPKDPYPKFNRGSWARYFPGNMLYIDDPTRGEIGFSPAFYYGLYGIDLYKCLAEYILHISDQLGIERENITIISSSNGGYAAIKISEIIKKSVCLAYCPILSIPLFFRFFSKDESQFEKKYVYL